MKQIIKKFTKYYLTIFCITLLIAYQVCFAQYSPWTSFSTANGLGDVEVYTIFEDSQNGDLWFGTRNGATRYNFETWTNYDLDYVNSPGNKVHAIQKDDSGNTWFGTEEGAIIFKNNSIIPGPDILANDKIWIITRDTH